MKSENFVGYLLKSANNGHGHGQDKFASNGYYESINKCMKKIYIYIHTWNPNDPCIDWNRPSFGGFNRQQSKNRGPFLTFTGPVIIW